MRGCKIGKIFVLPNLAVEHAPYQRTVAGAIARGKLDLRNDAPCLGCAQARPLFHSPAADILQPSCLRAAPGRSAEEGARPQTPPRLRRRHRPAPAPPPLPLHLPSPHCLPSPPNMMNVSLPPDRHRRLRLPLLLLPASLLPPPLPSLHPVSHPSPHPQTQLAKSLVFPFGALREA
eukprot:3393351-Prymnesium_polylepis.2